MQELLDKSKLIDFISTLGIEYENAKGRILNNDPKCYVDDIENISSFIIIDDYWHIPYNISGDKFAEFVKSIGIKHVGFCGVPKDILESYKHIGEVKWTNPCYLYEATELVDSLEHIIPDGFYLDSLMKYDVHIVDHLYTYRDDKSYEDITNDIVYRPSSVIRLLDGTPVSWVLIHSDNSLGIMYTKEKYRKMNFGKIVSADLVNKSLNAGYKPYIHIITDNENSIKLASAVGFTQKSEVEWIGYELY